MYALYDLYELYDLYDLYALCDLYALYDLYDLYNLYDLRLVLLRQKPNNPHDLLEDILYSSTS